MTTQNVRMVDDVVVLKAIWDLLGVTPPGAARAMTDMLDAREYLRAEGMPFKAIVKISGAFHISITTEVPDFLGIPSRTLQRRKDSGVLDFNESVTVFIAAELFQKAAAVLGNKESAAAWFKEPNRAIRNKRPIELLSDDLGRKLVEELLGRIEHGIYE